MRPAMLRADITSAHVSALASSRLRRHVGELGQLDENEDPKRRLSSNNLSALSEALPQLLSLNAAVEPSDVPVLFPSRLQRLDMRVVNPSKRAEWANAVVESIGLLSQLHTLRLGCDDGHMSLTPLRHLSLLRHLGLDMWFPYPYQTASELRALPWLHRIHFHRRSWQANREAVFNALLRDAPDEERRVLQWRDIVIPELCFTDELTPLLPRLPLLERLEASLWNCTRFDFLAALPRLTTLKIYYMSGMKDDAWRNLRDVFTLNGLARLHTLLAATTNWCSFFHTLQRSQASYWLIYDQ
jgi:hypothetical protein